MDKTYEPQNFERKIYQTWLDKKYFKSTPDKRPKFSVVMPPPNVTGQAHVGHALDNTIQDIIVRYKRMQGFNTCWLPGTDHAAIATEAKIVDALHAEGLSKDDIGRAEFIKRGWDWYKQYGDKIVSQLKRLGISPDWDRLAFTMDENLSDAVKHVFVKYYNEGKIYKGKRIVNWCPHCKSAISDIENEYQDQNTKLWHIRYPLVSGKGEIIVATTRPETIFGDTAVAVNPKDKRYAKLIGEKVKLPLTDREIPIIADEYCEMEFGTGAVKITPAHDPNDYELGLRHNLEQIVCIDDNGILTEAAGVFAGRDRLEARGEIEKQLEIQEYLVRVEKYKNKVGTCQRCHNITEPKISVQWYVKMDELVKPAIEAITKKELNFVPKRFTKVYLNWLNNIQDWCISRQLWLGHRIPAYTCKCGHMIVSETEPKKCSKCGCTELVQESDVLDTWFSSALWPFSTFGYPNKTEDLSYYYPTDVLVTAPDIIFFWVARMVFSGYELMGKSPFKYCLLHGLVKDKNGAKMSKSLGNGVDPIEMCDKYGADSLRWALLSGTSVGYDIKFSEDKIKEAKIFINKLYNAAKFVLSGIDGLKPKLIEELKLELKDKWILSELNNLVKQINPLMEKFEHPMVMAKISEFLIGKFCDWYIEMAKVNLYSNNNKETTQNVLYICLDTILKLMHPFIPFVTEEIYQGMPYHNETIMLEKFPEYDKKLNFNVSDFYKIMDIIKLIRNARAELNVPDNKRSSLYIKPIKDVSILQENLLLISKLGFGTNISIVSRAPEDNSVKVVSELCEIYIPLGELVDEDKEKKRIEDEIKSLRFEIERSEKMLSNAGFVNKAPKVLIEKEKEKIKSNTEKLNNLLESL